MAEYYGERPPEANESHVIGESTLASERAACDVFQRFMWLCVKQHFLFVYVILDETYKSGILETTTKILSSTDI